MSVVLKYFTSCMGNPYSKIRDFDTLHKRDDDEYGIEQVEEWKQKFPVTEEMKDVMFRHHDYACKIINSVKKLDLNYNTLPLVKRHLLQIGSQAIEMKEGLLDALSDNHPFKNDSDREELYGVIMRILWHPATGAIFHIPKV